MPRPEAILSVSVEGEQKGVEREQVNRKESEQILKATMHVKVI